MRFARHLRAALLGQPLIAWNVPEILGPARVGDIDEGGAVELVSPGQRIAWLGHLFGAAMMADIGDPATALLVNGRLVGAARLQVVAADECHILSLWARLSQGG